VLLRRSLGLVLRLLRRRILRLVLLVLLMLVLLVLLMLLVLLVLMLLVLLLLVLVLRRGRLVRIVGTRLMHHGRGRLRRRRIVDGRCRHVGNAGMGGLRTDSLLRNHVGADATDIIAGAWARSDGLRRVGARGNVLAGMGLERNTIGNWRRSRGGVVTDVRRKRRLELVRRHHVGIHAVRGTGRSAIAIFLVFLVVAAVEVGGASVFAW
jgi:hypothetical protein